MKLNQGLTSSLCAENRGKECYIVDIQNPFETQSIMWLYKVFQNGLVFVSLVAGIAVTSHMVYCRAAKCRNWLTVFTTVVTGFFHMITCLYLLGLSELSGHSELPHGGQPDCVDYSPTANVANVIILTLVAVNVIRQNFSAPWKYSAMVLQVLLSSTGLLILTRNSANQSSDMRQDVFIELGKREGSPHIDVFWSVCQKLVSDEKLTLFCEYGLIYIPVAVTFLLVWYKTYRRTGDIALIRVKVLDANCGTEGTSFHPCICTKLNTAFVAIIFYSFIVIFIGRPAMIIYGHLTSGYYRDILPSLLQTVMYCFLCSEYIMWCYRIDKVRPGLKSVKSGTVFNV